MSFPVTSVITLVTLEFIFFFPVRFDMLREILFSIGTIITVLALEAWSNIEAFYFMFVEGTGFDLGITIFA